MRSDLDLLVTYLLTKGGEAIVNDGGLDLDFPTIFVARLKAHGRFFDGSLARLVLGSPSQCHDNAEEYTELHPTAVWWTGFALSEDGRWRVHSWVLTGHSALVETTEKRVLYFGLPAALDPTFDDRFSRSDMSRIRRRYGIASTPLQINLS